MLIMIYILYGIYMLIQRVETFVIEYGKQI